MIHLVLAAIEISNSNLDGMESSFHSSRNGMTPFHSGRNGMSSPFWPEWNDHSIPAGMECPAPCLACSDLSCLFLSEPALTGVTCPNLTYPGLS